jgi:hypothetical protein
MFVCFSIINSFSNISSNFSSYHKNFISDEVILRGENHLDCERLACVCCLSGKALIEKYKKTGMSEECTVTYTKWENDINGRLVQITRELAFREAIEELSNQLPRFTLHHQIKRIQSSAYINDKQTSTMESPVLQIDFSENYCCDFQNEVQSAYYQKKQVSVFTCCIWQGEKKRNVVLLSDCMEHNKKSVSVFMTELITELKKTTQVLLYTLYIAFTEPYTCFVCNILCIVHPFTANLVRWPGQSI